ncbi:MAG: sigma-70 family RNA polymerase sigma factor, partial [Planctomycetota bacterium]
GGGKSETMRRRLVDATSTPTRYVVVHAMPADTDVQPDTPAQAANTAPTPPPILPAVARRESGATTKCIDRYGGLVWSVARKLCLSESDAEDATQEVFIELWSKADRFDPSKGSEPAFVATVARRRLIDFLRKAGRREAPTPIEAVSEPVASATEVDDEAAAAREAMAGLSEQQRTVLGVSVYDGLSYPEIAEKLGMPLPTVKSHAQRGMAAVRDAMKRRAEAAEIRRKTYRNERNLN